jgi:hypothetical protein
MLKASYTSSLRAHALVCVAQGFLARACGFWHMQLEQPAADADTPPAIRRFGPLKCRPQAVYAREQLLAGTRKHPEGAALREFDVLKRARVRGPILRECTTTGAQFSQFTQCAQFT